MKGKENKRINRGVKKVLFGLASIILLLVLAVGALVLNIVIGSGLNGSVKQRIMMAGIIMMNQGETLSDMNSNDKPNMAYLWDDDIPSYDLNNTKLLEDSKENIKPYIPSFFWSSGNKILESNFRMKPKLLTYELKTGDNNPAMIICPGGGYLIRTEKEEGTDIAEWLNANGISAFVLDYRLTPYGLPVSLGDAQRAIRYLRYHADEYNIDPDRIGIMGFSAGGNLAATLGTHYDSGNPNAHDSIENMSSRPDLMVLCYTATSNTGEFAFPFAKIVLGNNPSKEMIDFYTIDKQVTSNTPPAFIWQTKTDDIVSVQNSYMYADAFETNNVPYELHLFPSGPHGLGLAKEQEGAMEWPDLCIKWLRAQGF